MNRAITRALLMIVITGAVLASVVGAAASLSLVGSSNSLGGGAAIVDAPPAVLNVDWTLDPTFPSKVLAVTVTFQPITSAFYDVHLALLDGSDVVLKSRATTEEINGTGFNTVQWLLLLSDGSVPSGTLPLASQIAKFQIAMTGPMP